MKYLLPFTAITLHQKNLKKMERKPILKGNFIKKLRLSNAHCFIRLQIDHPDRVLQKHLEKNKVRGCP